MNVRRYGWVVIVASLLATGAVYLLSVPVVAVTAQTRDVIRPGMTATEAVKIIGGPPRWYDGICSFSGGVPGNPTNFYKPTWVTSSGQLVLGRF